MRGRHAREDCSVQSSAATSAHATVTRPLNFFNLAHGYVDLERSVVSDGGLAFLFGNGVVTRGHGNPEVTVVVGLEGRHRAVFFHDKELRLSHGGRIGLALFRWSTMNGTDQDYPFNCSC